MTKTAIIVAGGTGKRMNSEIPKQFIEINGLPVLMHTIKIFYKYDNSIEFIIVLPKDQIDYWIELRKKHNFLINHRIIEGGKTRFHSTQNALKLLEKKTLVAVHDGVRPLVSIDTISRCFRTAEIEGNAIPVIPINESIRKIDKNDNFPVNRDDYVLIQTPEVFHSDILIDAFKQDYSNEFTACAYVIENLGIKLNLVEGNKENIKITNQFDLSITKCLLEKQD